MGRRSPPDPAIDLRRIRKERDKARDKAPRARLRIMIAGDPSRPIRTISLPHALPVLASVGAGILVLATVILACGSWKMSGARSVLERRVLAMVQAADSVALHPGGAAMDPTVLSDARGALMGPPTRAPGGEVGSFVVQSVNNGEEMEVRFNLNTGELEADAYRRFRHLMRCLHTGAETPIDPRLIDLLYRIARRTHQKIALVSGFRAPMFSLARLSYHTRGMAADIRIPGMTPLMARDLADSMGVRGIGYYPVSGFIHVDVREERVRWTDYGQNRQDSDGAEHGPGRSDSIESDPEPSEDLHSDTLSLPDPTQAAL
jgi:uncharacterized protein YcbK (DUF882 family)